MFAMGLAQVPLVLGMADELQMLGIPAGVDPAPVVQLPALRDRAAE